MTSQQYIKIISLYEKAIDKTLKPIELDSEIKQVRLDLDSSFVANGKECTDAKEYLDKLLKLQNTMP